MAGVAKATLEEAFLYIQVLLANLVMFFGFLPVPLHSELIRNLIKLKGTAKLIVQGDRVCLRIPNVFCLKS